MSHSNYFYFAAFLFGAASSRRMCSALLARKSTSLRYSDKSGLRKAAIVESLQLGIWWCSLTQVEVVLLIRLSIL